MDTSPKLEKRLRLVGWCGVFFCVVSLILYMAVPKITKMLLDEELLLFDNTTVFKHWRTIPIPIYLKVHLFNVTNPQKAEKGHKPILSEVGPYVYRITTEKREIKWGRGNKTLSFDYKYIFNFEESLSEGRKETDVVCMLNLPAVATADYGMSDEYKDFADIINDILEEEEQELFINLKVKEFLFDGYEAKFLHELAHLSPKVNELVPDAMFGVFYGQNNSIVKNITVFTGKDNKNLLGKIYSIGGKRKIDKWDDPYCNMVNGSDGITFPPGITSNSKLRFYLFQLERSFLLQYITETEIHNIPVTEFALHPTTFEKPEKYPANECFCNTEVCKYNGLFNCKALKAAKIYVSMPHFTGADKELYENYIGIKPDEKKYRNAFLVQPQIGFTLDFEFRLQFNILITPSNEFSIIKNLKSTQTFPVLWFYQTGKLAENFAEELYELLIAPVKMADIMVMTCFVLGVIAIMTSVISNIYISQKKRKPFGPGKISPINPVNLNT